GPQCDVGSAIGEDLREGGAPASGAQHGHPAGTGGHDTNRLGVNQKRPVSFWLFLAGSHGSAGGVSPRRSAVSCVMATITLLVAAASVWESRGRPRNSDRSTGSPTLTWMVLRGNRLIFLPYRGITFWVPQCESGISGMSASSAIRTAPVLPRIGHRSGSLVREPSG